MKFQIDVIRYPTGRYGFVGSGVPLPLAYRKRDGAEFTPAEIDVLGRCGPGFVPNVESVSFESEDMAWKVASLLGIARPF